jgi:hypothetical protein
MLATIKLCVMEAGAVEAVVVVVVAAAAAAAAVVGRLYWLRRFSITPPERPGGVSRLELKIVKYQSGRVISNMASGLISK